MAEQKYIQIEISRKLKDSMMAAAEKVASNPDSKISSGRAALNALKKSSKVRPLVEFIGDNDVVGIVILDENSEVARIAISKGNIKQEIVTENGKVVKNELTTSDGTPIINEKQEKLVEKVQEETKVKPPKETWTYVNPTTETPYIAGINEDGQLVVDFGGDWEVIDDEEDKAAILKSKPQGEKKKLKDLLPKPELVTEKTPEVKAEQVTPPPEEEMAPEESTDSQEEPQPDVSPKMQNKPEGISKVSNKDKEVEGTPDEALSYLKIIAKNFISIPWIARDLNVTRQNIVKLIKIKGGEAATKADAMFMKESDLEKKLESEKEKFTKKSPEQVKGDGEKEKKGMFPKLFDKFKETKVGKKVVGKTKSLLKGLKALFSPKNFMKVLGKIALPLLIITTIWQGLTSAWDTWKETGSIWEAFKAGIGGIVDFLTFGLIDKKMVSDFYDWSFDAITGVMQSIADFFGFGEFFAEKLGVVKEFLGIGVKKKEAQDTDKLKLEQPKEEKAPEQKPEPEPQQQSVLVDSEGNPVRTGYGGVVTTGEAPQAAPAPATGPAPVPKEEKKAPASEGKPVKVASEQGKNAMLKAMDGAKITDPTQRAAIMAQVGHESGGFAVLSENLNYKAPTLMKLFPKKFSGPDDAQKVAAGGPESVAERIYGGRMGNAPEGGGDGFKYRGRGFIQLTGKQNYTRFGVASNPDSVSSLKEAADTAIKYMAGYKGDWSNVKAVTKFVNGGYIGLDDRVKHFQQYLNDPTITKVGAAPTAPSGGEVSSASTTVASDQRQQQKPQTPNVINSATVNNNTTVKKQLATEKPDRNSTSDAMVARAA